MATIDRSAGWRAVDSNADTAARYLETLTRLLDAQKRQSFDLLQLAPGMSVLEIGCGLGRDVEAIATRVGPTGRVVGIDASHELIAKAIERTAAASLPVRYEVGDAHALSFATDSFDAARVDRVLEHLADPAQAVRELARVVRPGGRLSAIEPDWETMSVAGVDLDVTRAVVRHKTDVSIAHGTMGRELRRLLVEAGCRDVTFEQGAITFGQLALADMVMSLRKNLDGAREKGWITAAQADAWWAGLQAQDQAGMFYGAMCGVIAAGTVA